MNNCLIDILDPKGHMKTPCNAYLTFMNVDGVTTPKVRCYASNCTQEQLAVLLWIAESAIEQLKNDIPDSRESVDLIKAAAVEFGLNTSNIFNSETTQISILKDALTEDDDND